MPINKPYKAFLLFSMVILLSFGGCKKDEPQYPEDIPEWLKYRIEDYIKETEDCSGCCYDLCIYIDEYSNGTDTTYWFMPGRAGPVVQFVYDVKGNYLCNDDQYNPEFCDTLIFGQVFIRRIWEEK